MVVQHNLQAMNANRMLGITTNQVSSSTEKLSSGYKINRAADDAAGLAISEKMRKQIRGLNQAASNAEDGISCVQTAEGALAEVQDMLQRMNELCVQAANGTNSVSDRQYIQDEIDQLIEEVDRVAETTKFNEIYLLKGDETAGTTSAYVTNYSVTYTVNQTSNAEDGIPYKVNYTGTNNIYITSRDVIGNSSSSPVSADKIQTGDDISKYLTVSDMADNQTGTSLDTNNYVAFVNVELDSYVDTGDDGYVASATYGRTTHDLSTDGITDTVRANKTIYIYNTSTDTITTLSAGDEMTEYLNDDNTIKDEYRMVDILDGGGAAVYRGTEISKAYLVDYTSSTIGSVDSTDLDYNDDITELWNAADTANKAWGYEDSGSNFSYSMSTSTNAGTGITTYTYSWGSGYVYYNDNIYSVASGSESNTTGSTSDISVTLSAVAGTASNTTIALPDLYGKDILTEIGNDDIYHYGSAERVKKQILGTDENGDYTVNFVWSDSELEYDTSAPTLYDADGNEVSGVALHKYFDDNGNYTGGLFTTSQARAIDEVFANDSSEAYNKITSLTGAKAATIGSFITQSATQVAAALDFNLHVGADSDRTNKIGVSIDTLTAAGLGITMLSSANIGIVDETGDNATDAIDVIADALTMVSRQRSALGAVQNRLEHSINNLDNVVENTTAAESQIRDTDMAEEMVTYSNNNILQQAGQSMLAQANQANQGVLSLLQ